MGGTVESRYVRLQIFRSLMKKHLHRSGRFNGAYFVIKARAGGFSGLFGSGAVQAVRIDSASEGIFQHGWEDISIHVLLEAFFDGSITLGEDYERLSRRTVTVFCRFRIGPGDRLDGLI